MHKITPFLWFENQAEEAVKFYTSIFKNSKTGAIAPYEENGAQASGQPVGSVMTVEFELEGQKFMALNGGPLYKFNPSISFFVNCADEKEVEELYAKLSPGGSVLMALDTYPWSAKYAWINDQFGVSWQLFVAKGPSQKIVPCLMFTKGGNGKAEEAMKLYTSIFPKSEIKFIARYEEGEPNTKGFIKHAQFSLVGQDFVAMDGGDFHAFDFTNQAISFVVACKDQEEIDTYWKKLTENGGQEVQCGWLMDKFGLPWQIIPVDMDQLLKTPSAMKAMFGMKKIIIKDLK